MGDAPHTSHVKGRRRRRRSALLFPGQGSQEEAMRALAREHCPELIEQAASRLGRDPFDGMDEATVYLQPAIYCGTLAYWRAAGEPRADFAAGHSLGELAALTVAGCMTPQQGLALVMARAGAMQRAAQSAPPGGLLAVIGARERALALGRLHRLTLAADNEPEQVVLSGADDRLRAARAQARGHLRAVRLRVPAALHSSAMRPAVRPFLSALRQAGLRVPQMVVIANVTASPFGDVAAELAQGVVSCVRWRETVLALHAAGVRSYHEMGAQGTLSGLVERTLAGGAEAASPTRTLAGGAEAASPTP